MEEDSLSVVDDARSEEMLQELRDWQQEQKKRLAEQQAQQRLLLLEKQKKLLSMINSAENSSPYQDSDSAAGLTESYRNHPSDADDGTPRIHNQAKPCPRSVDDVPLRKPRAVRSFQQMLETSLTNKGESGEPNEGQPGAEKKFPFLKRGQGISRFGTVSQPKKSAGKPSSGAKTKGKENKAPVPSKPANKSLQSKNLKPVANIAPKQPAVQIIELDEAMPQPSTSAQIIPYQPQVSQPSRSEPELEFNSSRTEEDLAVFELLERFATINASFSSSSSLIGQLIDKGVTHLPSPSKVLSFLSKRRAAFPASAAAHGEEFYSGQAPPKTQKTKHVHFAENVEDDEEDLSDKPWLSGITEQVLSQSHPSSPFISNTVQAAKPLREPERPAPQLNLDETPTSPIGFPDYQKLFGNPARTLWSNDDVGSPDNDTDPRSRLTDPDTDLRGIEIVAWQYSDFKNLIINFIFQKQFCLYLYRLKILV